MAFKVRSGFSGVEDIDNVLKQLPKSIGKNILRGGMKDSAKPFIKEAIANAPKDTEEGAKSIKARNNKDLKDVGISIGPSKQKFHMALQEFGTVHQAPQTFFRPAWEANVRGMMRSFANFVRARITKTVKSLRKRAEKGTLGKRTADKFRQL